MTQALKEQNGLVLAMFYAGFFPFPVEGGYSIGLHADAALRTPKQIQQYQILQGGLERSIAYRTGFPDTVTAMVWGAQTLGLHPVADAPGGVPDSSPAGMTVAVLQTMIREIARTHMGDAMVGNQSAFFASLMTLLVESVGGMAQAGRRHPNVIGVMAPMLQQLGFAGTVEQMTAKMTVRAANALFLVAVIADRCGADLQAVVEAIPSAVVPGPFRKE